MTTDVGKSPNATSQQRYVWPWFVLAAVLLAIGLAVLWMRREIERTRRIRELNTPAAGTNHTVSSPAPAWLVQPWPA